MQDTLDRLEKIVQRINTHPEFSQEAKGKFDSAIRAEAARLLQSHVLKTRGYPAAIITAPEKDFYASLLQNVIRERQESGLVADLHNPTANECLFYKFIGSKVLQSAEQLELDLSRHRHYHVAVTGVKDRALQLTIAKKLRGLGRRQGNYGVSVATPQGKGKQAYGILDVHGDLSTDDLKGVLDSVSAKYDLKYKIK